MSDAVRNLIYPPVIDTYQPSNCVKEDMIITFIMPEYNLQHLNDIKSVHVSLTNQSNNASVLDSGQVKIIKWEHSVEYNEKTRIGKIKILPRDIVKTSEPPSFQNILYKIQLRFDFGSGPEQGETLNSYLTTNKDKFSEWSSVSLIKPIIKPELIWQNPFSGSNKVGEKINYTFEATLKFDYAETDTLKSYRFTLNKGVKNENEEIQDESSKKLILTMILDGGWKEPEEPFLMKQAFNLYSLKDNIPEHLIIKIEYETTGGYHGEEIKELLLQPLLKDSPVTINSIFSNEEYGFNEIKIVVNKNNSPSTHTCELFRSENDGAEWNKIKEINFNTLNYDNNNNNKEGLLVKDSFIKSGMVYKYALQLSPNNGENNAYMPDIWNKEVGINNFYNATLMRDNKILKLSFDFTVSQYSKKAGRAMSETLGGRYPKFTKNGHLNYKQCSISGKISIEDNLDGYFITMQDLLGETLYERLMTQHEHGNSIYRQLPQNSMVMIEREFREKVYDWLNDGKPKLFKSGPEGNMIVILDGVSLTSEKALGRLIYNFSATMYEVGDSNDYNSLVSLGIVVPEEIGVN